MSYKIKTNRIEKPLDVQYNPKGWKPYISDKPLYRSFEGTALKDFIETKKIRPRYSAEEISLSKSPLGVGWAFVRVNPKRLQEHFWERIYEKDTTQTYKNEQEVALFNSSILLKDIEAIGISDYVRHGTLHQEEYKRLRQFAKENNLPIYVVYSPNFWKREK
jgi:hypothetical protein